MGGQRCLSGRVRRRPGSARAAVYVRRLPWCRDRRMEGRRALRGGDFPAVLSVSGGCAAVLGRAAEESRGAGGTARCQRRRCGLLLAAFYDPVWTAGILNKGDYALASAAFLLLFMWATPPWLVVVLSAAVAQA